MYFHDRGCVRPLRHLYGYATALAACSWLATRDVPTVDPSAEGCWNTVYVCTTGSNVNKAAGVKDKTKDHNPKSKAKSTATCPHSTARAKQRHYAILSALSMISGDLLPALVSNSFRTSKAKTRTQPKVRGTAFEATVSKATTKTKALTSHTEGRRCQRRRRRRQ